MRIANAAELGSYIRESRQQLGLTQAQLAARAEVSRRWLSDLENGKDTAEFGRVIRTVHAVDLILDLQPRVLPGELDLDVYLRRFRNPDAKLRRPV